MNIYDQFDSAVSANPYDQFDAPQQQLAQTVQNSTLNPADDPYGLKAAEAYGQQQQPDIAAVTAPFLASPAGQIAENAATGLSRTAGSFVPRSVLQGAGMVEPAIGSIEQLGKTARAIRDVFSGRPLEETIQTQFPESQTFVEAEKTPPYSPERFQAGFGTAAQLLMARGIAEGLKAPLTAADAIRARTEAPSPAVEPSVPKTGEPAPPLEPVPEGQSFPLPEHDFARVQEPTDLTQMILRRRDFLQREAQAILAEDQASRQMGVRSDPSLEERFNAIRSELEQLTAPIEEPTNASNITETEGMGLRGQGAAVGEETPLRQSGETPVVPQQQEIGAIAGSEDIPATSQPETTGIAQRISERQTEEGKIGPIQPGQGASWQEMVARGDELIQNEGIDPDRVAAEFSRDGTINGDRMAVLRARDTDLAHEATIAEEALRQNPNDQNLHAAYKQAFDRWTDWRQNKVKPAQTVWHLAGEAMQGEEPIDVTSYTGIRRAVVEQKGRDLSPVESKEAIRFSDQVRQASVEENGVLGQFDQVVRKNLGNKRAMTLDELRDRIAKETEVLCP